MKSAQIHGYGETPSVTKVPVPDLGPGDVLIRVHAASLNPLDVKLLSGAMSGYFPLVFPYTVGTDLAGTIERVGSDATTFKVGDRVVARPDPTRGGALAEYAVVPAASVTAIPGDVSTVDAAAVPTAAGTAEQALFEVADLRAGQTVLIHAGAGGVGSFAIQLARLAGARVIATASGTGIEIARRLGADQVIDYRLEDFDRRVSDVDVVLDTVGGETQQRSFDVLRGGGVLVSTVSLPDEALAKAHGVTASFVFHQTDALRNARLLERVATGAIKILVDRQVPLEAFDDAFRHQSSGRARGKVVIGLA